MTGCCEHCNEHSGFVKGREFLDWLSILLASQDFCFLGLDLN
jgi:hypothetical protein